MQKNKNVSSLPSSRRRARGRGVGDLHPGPFHGSIHLIRKQRYVATATLGGVAITPARGVFGLQCALTATTGQSIAVGGRIKAIEMWGPPGTTTPVTVSCEWGGSSIYQSHKIDSDTSIGSTFAAHVRSVPPDDYVSTSWIDESNTVTLALLSGPAGTVVDVTCELILRNGESPPTATTIAGATAGELYVRPLDGSGLLVPASYTTY